MPNEFKKLGDLDISDNTNIVDLAGEVEGTPVYSHAYNDVPYYSVRLKVARKHSDRYNNIHIFVPKNDLIVDSVILDSGVRVEVKGKLVQSELCGMNDISVVADKITLIDETTEDKNQVYLGGCIHRLFDLKPIANSKKVVKQMIIKNSYSEGSKSSFTAKVSCWNNIGNLVNEKYAEGDRIFIRGQLESRLAKLKDADDSDQKSNVLLHEITAAVILDFTDN